MAKVKVTDYIVQTLIEHNIDTVFGYPGGSICHLMDSLYNQVPRIQVRINYHEQASAFAACGYAQTSGKLAAVFATSGPGATNLVTGIANAWYDSLPVLFLTGQVDTYALKSLLKPNIRQYGFQETDIISMVKSITKYSVQITSAQNIVDELHKAIYIATTGRKGPVLLDLPADIQRAYIQAIPQNQVPSNEPSSTSNFTTSVVHALSTAKRPVVLAGAGINQCGLRDAFRTFVAQWQLPVLTSMPAVDLLAYDNPLHCGFIGVNGHRYANMILAKSDCVLCLGTRLDLKQIGLKRNFFTGAPRVLRVDIDPEELNYAVTGQETNFRVDLKKFLKTLNVLSPIINPQRSTWLSLTQDIKKQLEFANDNEPIHAYLRKISSLIIPQITYTLDVGQNEGWAAQSLMLKNNQKIIMSAGLGTMGYALPAAIGAYYATQNPVVAIVGDGGLQMNIQELQFIATYHLPITIILCNNASLGMIRQFQENNFQARYFMTTAHTGYTVPNFEKVAQAYGLNYKRINNSREITSVPLDNPNIIELKLSEITYLQPSFGETLLYDQEPLLDRNLFNHIMRK